jgi:hypothetical protein
MLQVKFLSGGVPWSGDGQLGAIAKMQRYARIFAAIFLGIGAGSVAAEQDSSPQVLENAVIVSYTGEPEAGSGVWHFVVGMRVRDKAGTSYDFVITYGGKGQHFPKIGTACNIKYRYDDIYSNMKRARYVLKMEDAADGKKSGDGAFCGCNVATEYNPARNCIGEKLNPIPSSGWEWDDDGKLHMK